MQLLLQVFHANTHPQVDEAGTREAGVAARIDPGERREVDRGVEGDVVIAAAASDPEADGGDLLALHINPGHPGLPLPVQAMRGEEVDPRYDIYSLGAIGYECLAGAPPYTGSDQKEVLIKQCLEDPAPLLGLLPASETSAEFAGFIERLMCRDRELRLPVAG